MKRNKKQETKPQTTPQLGLLPEPTQKDRLNVTVKGFIPSLRLLTEAKSIEGVIAALKSNIVPYWLNNEWIWPAMSHFLLEIIRMALIKLRAKSDRPYPSITFHTWLELQDWLTDSKRVPKRKGNHVTETLPAEAKLLGILALSSKGVKKPSITYIAKKAGVSRKTAHASPLFMSTYETFYPPIPKKGSRYSLDENRD